MLPSLPLMIQYSTSHKDPLRSLVKTSRSGKNHSPSLSIVLQRVGDDKIVLHRKSHCREDVVFSRDWKRDLVSWRHNENWKIDGLPHASRNLEAPYVFLNEANVKKTVSCGCCVLVESTVVP
jgi:hypothetical protein